MEHLCEVSLCFGVGLYNGALHAVQPSILEEFLGRRLIYSFRKTLVLDLPDSRLNHPVVCVQFYALFICDDNESLVLGNGSSSQFDRIFGSFQFDL